MNNYIFLDCGHAYQTMVSCLEKIVGLSQDPRAMAILLSCRRDSSEINEVLSTDKLSILKIIHQAIR